jgi:RNA polymerase sigma-70 factor (ECF subfamily)
VPAEEGNQTPAAGVYKVDQPFAKVRVTETDLIRRARRGDDAAWESLVRRYQERVFRLAYLLTGDADEAEDVAQEAFIRAFRSLSRFDADRPLQPWLLRITANLAHNRRRAAGRYRAALQRAAQDSPKPVEPGVERKSSLRREAGALWQAVRRLSRLDREVIYLRHFLELSVADTADALGIAEGTVKSRLHRALKRLRDVVEADYPELVPEVSDE